MREVVERLKSGQFEYERGTLEFSVPRVELTLREGEDAEGSFEIRGVKEQLTEGRVSSSELRMEVLTPEFTGAQDTVSYRFRSEGLVSGDVLQGNFRIISNQGEYLLPFVVTMEMAHAYSSLGDIRNLFHFANLAKSNWKEAVEHFYSDGFAKVFQGNDKQYQSLYRGLRAASSSEQNVEEFLLCVNKKQKIAYLPDQTEIHVDNKAGVTEHTVVITRNGWGYTALDAELDGDFLEADKLMLREQDFTGTTCRFRFRLDNSKLHEGRNLGRITFRGAYDSFTVDIVATQDMIDRRNYSEYREKKQLTVEIMQLYTEYRCKKMSSRAWLTETGRIISRMNAVDEHNLVFRLYGAHYLITAGRLNEAKWILDQISVVLENSTASELLDPETADNLNCYYLYLTTLCSREENNINEVVQEIREVFSRRPGSWRIAWLLQYLEEPDSVDASKRFARIQDLYENGSHSPVLYIECMQLWTQSPSLLMQFGSLELNVLHYCAKHKMMTMPLLDQIVYLAGRQRTYDARLLEVLQVCWELRQSDDVLTAIGTLLIKGERTDKEAFVWYGRAVERQLRITRLYEYYMMSIEPGEDGRVAEIPRLVLMYFSYQSNLDYRQNAILYRYMLEHRTEYPELYATYEPQIQKFVAVQLDVGHINRDLGVLYQNLMTPQMVDVTNAAKILTLLYTAQIRVEDPRICRVIVIYDRIGREMSYPVTDGSAQVPLFGGDYAILLADREDNRFSVSIPYDTEKLLIPGKLLQMVLPYIQKGDENVRLYLCESSGGACIITMDNVSRYRNLADSQILTPQSRGEIRDRLIRFYYDHDFQNQMAEYLEAASPEAFTPQQRGDLLELMVLTGMYEKALDWLHQYGTYGIDPRIIVRMSSRMPDPERFASDPMNLEILYYAFRKSKYDDTMLGMLVSGFSGTTREMRDIWKAATSFGLETWPIAERMLVQMMYTGAYIGEGNEIFQNFLREGGGNDVEIAYLAQNAYEHVVHDRLTDEQVYTQIAALTRNHTELPLVCGIGYLKFYAESGKSGQGDEEISKQFLRDLVDRGLCFAFYQEYLHLLPQMIQFQDKSIIEYKTKPGTVCCLHYMFNDDGNGSADYQETEMKEMYDGIFVTSFILFFGEQLQYYITEETSSQLTESGTVSRSEIGRSAEGQFALINDLMIARTLQDGDTVAQLLQDYYRNRYFCEQFFKRKT